MAGIKIIIETIARLTRASAQRWRSRCLMRSKEAFASSRSTGYLCSVAVDHSAPFSRVTPRRAGACHDATGMERHDILHPVIGDGRFLMAKQPSHARRKLGL